MLNYQARLRKCNGGNMMNLILLLKDYLYTKDANPPRVYRAEETIELIIQEKLSVSRFGDGEFDMLLNINHPKYQKNDSNLVYKLNAAFNSNKKNLLVCIPDVFSSESLKPLTGKAARHWKRFLIKNRQKLYQIFNFDKEYGDALFTRHYIDIKDKSKSHIYFNHVKEIWNNRDIIVVEGKYTRFGVGNDLLDNAKSVQRILCPEKNAYDKYDDIFEVCKQQDKDTLFLIALGPTATVLAYDLCNEGFQAIDIGHLDIEYEWFLKHADKKCAVANKWVNETDDIVTNENDTLYDEEYENSIISRIENKNMHIY